MNQYEQEELLAIVKRNLPIAEGISTADIHSLPGGGNNRLYKITIPGNSIVLKRYFLHPGDLRNRLDNEYRFSQFLWQRGVRCIPEPIARDNESCAGLYRFVDGTSIEPTLVADLHLHEALAFLCQVNKLRSDAESLTLPSVSEACFTLQQHFDMVEQRVERLFGLSQTDGIQGQTADFVRQKLRPAWDYIRVECLTRSSEMQQNLDYPVDAADRILSPSDFGFHNALQTVHGLVFHDFEYAGWDDPAKTVCDFFCQIAVPVPIRYWGEISSRWAQLTRAPEKTLLRMNVLLPLYRIKWVCIALNHFLSVDSERRRFAKGDEEMHLTKQLNLAEKLLSSIQLWEKEP